LLISLFEYRVFHDGALGVQVRTGGSGPLSLSALDLLSVCAAVAQVQPVHRLQLDVRESGPEDDQELADFAAAAQGQIALYVEVGGQRLPAWAAQLPHSVWVTDEPWLQFESLAVFYDLEAAGGKPPILRAGVAPYYWVYGKTIRAAYEFARVRKAAGDRTPWRLCSEPKLRQDLAHFDTKAFREGAIR